MILPEWTPFDTEDPPTGKPLLIRLKDGRELKGARFHTELWFEDIKPEDDKWEMQMQSTHWRYA